MIWIVPDILTLMQYLTAVEQKPRFSNEQRCPRCGKIGLWRHGCYGRKADREHSANESLNPLFIQRFFCKSCRRTCSALPECIPPKRWYLWDVQQKVLLLLLAGKSLRAAAKEVIPSRQTIRRWVARFKEQFHRYKDVLCHHAIELGRTSDFIEFWQTCLVKMSLAKAMRLCHVSGVDVP